MAKKSIFTSKYDTPKKLIQCLIEWMSHGVSVHPALQEFGGTSFEDDKSKR